MDNVLFGRVVDAPLDDQGERQAQVLAQHLAAQLHRPIIEASPRLRTQQTAAAIAARCDCEVRTRVEFDEIDFGRWSGRTFRDLDSDPEWREWNAARATAHTPAGETIAGVQQRATDRFYSIAREYASRTIVIVTHSEIIRSLVLFCLGASPNCYAYLAVDPASVTRLSLSEDGMRVISVNERVAS